MIEYEQFQDDHELIEAPKETIEQIITDQPIFFEMEAQQGNFDFLIHPAIQLSDIDRLDSSGYAIIHHAITYARVDVVQWLLKKGADPHIKSINQQTCLMVSCSFGQLQLVKQFIELGQNINDQDAFGLTPLMYSVKSKNHRISFYLIYLGANLDVKDKEGCSLFHWAAYNNDVNQFFQQITPLLAYDLSQDSKGFTPADRALRNYSYESLTYLLEEYPQLIPKQMYNVESKSIKRIINKAKRDERKRNKSRLNLLKSFPRATWVFIIAFWAALFFDIFFRQIDHLLGHRYGYNLTVIIIVNQFCTVLYSILFILFTTNQQNEGKNINELLGHPKMHYDCKHKHFKEKSQSLEITNLCDDIEQQNPSQDNVLYRNSFIQQLYYEIRNESQFQLDLQQTCTVCMQVRKKKVSHCKVCNQCVIGFHFHSKVFNKCINGTNHFFYFLFLLLHLIQSNLLIYILYLIHIKDIGIIAFLHITTYPQLFIYLLLFMLNSRLSLLTLLNLYCILTNFTYEELMNSHKFKYLHEIVEKQGTLLFIRKVNFNIIDNIKDYIWESFMNLKIL